MNGKQMFFWSRDFTEGTGDVNTPTDVLSTATLALLQHALIEMKANLMVNMESLQFTMSAEALKKQVRNMLCRRTF